MLFRSWAGSHIIKILRNEKYVGDLVQKKTYTPDYLTHAKKYNHGEEPMVELQDHHEPIIDRELWNVVQAELARRNPHGEQPFGHSNRYIFSGKIKCGECGASFVSRKKKRKDGSVYDRMSGKQYTAEGIGEAPAALQIRHGGTEHQRHQATAEKSIKAGQQQFPSDRLQSAKE